MFVGSMVDKPGRRKESDLSVFFVIREKKLHDFKNKATYRSDDEIMIRVIKKDDDDIFGAYTAYNNAVSRSFMKR